MSVIIMNFRMIMMMRRNKLRVRDDLSKESKDPTQIYFYVRDNDPVDISIDL